MEIVEIARFLDKQFQKKSYKELSANNNGSLIESEKCEAYDFDEIVEYIFPRNKPTSADAMLIRNTNIFLIEFKSGFQRKFSEKNFDQRQCQCEETGAICEKYAKLLKRNLKNIEKELKSNLFQKASESRWILEYHFFPEFCKGCEYDKFRVHYIIVIDKVKENPVDSMEQIIDEMANIHRTENFYERMEASVKRLYCESRFGKKAFYHKVAVCSVQEFKLDFLEC